MSISILPEDLASADLEEEMDKEKLCEALKEVMMKFIGDADWDGIDHPYWDEDTVDAMTDAAMAVIQAVDATQRNKNEWTG